MRRTAKLADEVLVSIDIPVLKPSERGTFLKFGLRQAQAISVVNVAWSWIAIPSNIRVSQKAVPDAAGRFVGKASIASGAAARTILRADEAESFLAERAPTDELITQAADPAAQAAQPISDARASAEYRRAPARTDGASAASVARWF